VLGQGNAVVGSDSPHAAECLSVVCHIQYPYQCVVALRSQSVCNGFLSLPAFEQGGVLKRRFLWPMRKLGLGVVVLGASVVACSPLLYAQRPADWMTVGNDAQRSSWVRRDAKISVEALRKPGFDLIWKIKLNEAKQSGTLTPPALLDFYISYRGFRSLGFVGGSSGTVTGIDIDLARVEWEKRFPSTAAGASSGCPGGMTSSVTRPTVAGYPGTGGFGSFGRSTPAKSGVGEPYEGAVTLKEREARLAAAATLPPPTTASRRTAPPTNPYAPTVLYVHAITADGKFHSMYVSNGDEPNPPVAFLPRNANARGLIVFDKTAYVATVNNCGGAANGVWALNLESQKVSQWKSNGEVIGATGFAVGPEGTLYVASSSGALVALEPRTLSVKGTYKAGSNFSSSPIVFEYRDKDFVAVTTSDGRLHLLDAEEVSGPPVATTKPFSSSGFAIGSLASWQDSAGTRWILAPAGGAVASGGGFASNGEITNGAIVAFKLVEENATHVLQPGWVSRDMVSPLPPTIVNGVVFGLSSGEFRSDDGRMTEAQRVQRSSKAVLYALDAATGKELWNSGSAIASFVSTGGLAAGGGRVYVGGQDGAQYVFGFPMEH
jgi:putative pyrroloquinoline-quinone binding quinoprotein